MAERFYDVYRSFCNQFYGLQSSIWLWWKSKPKSLLTKEVHTEEYLEDNRIKPCLGKKLFLSWSFTKSEFKPKNRSIFNRLLKNCLKRLVLIGFHFHSDHFVFETKLEDKWKWLRHRSEALLTKKNKRKILCVERRNCLRFPFRTPEKN